MAKTVIASRQLTSDLAHNYSTAAQVITAATRTYITGSQVTLPASKLKVGSIIRWTLSMTKTAAGTAASTYDIAFGTAGTTADTARISFTKPAGTGVADTAKVVIECTIRGPISASGTAVGHFNLTHNLAATGFATIPCVNVLTVSGAFDLTVPTFVGVCITSGASEAVTIQQVITEIFNL